MTIRRADLDNPRLGERARRVLMRDRFSLPPARRWPQKWAAWNSETGYGTFERIGGPTVTIVTRATGTS